MIERIIRGCGYVPGYGEHPGTVPLIMLVIAGALAGTSRGILGSLVGAALMGVLFGIPYLCGAYERGKGKNP